METDLHLLVALEICISPQTCKIDESELIKC